MCETADKRDTVEALTAEQLELFRGVGLSAATRSVVGFRFILPDHQPTPDSRLLCAGLWLTTPICALLIHRHGFWAYVLSLASRKRARFRRRCFCEERRAGSLALPGDFVSSVRGDGCRRHGVAQARPRTARVSLSSYASNTMRRRAAGIRIGNHRCPTL